MYWLDLNWIIPNWMPLVAALLLGFILGWLLTGMSPARRARELEERVSEVETKHRKSERDAGDLRRQVEPLNARVASLQADADTAAKRVTELTAQATKLTEEKAALEASLAEQAAALAAESDRLVENTYATDLEGDLEEGFAQRTAAVEVPDVAASFAGVAQTLAPPSYDPREVALSEAYARAAALQRELDEQTKLLASRSAQLDERDAELVAANAVRKELETRLLRAREDVASELAMLASTMIKMKDDALARADSRIVALKSELETLRSTSGRTASRSADRALDTAD